MSIKTLDILEQVKDLTLLETADLVKKIELTFGVDASFKTFAEVKRSLIAPPELLLNNQQPPEPSETISKTEFDVVLDKLPADRTTATIRQKIAIIKIVRSLTGLGFKEVKELVKSAESAPRVVLSAVDGDTVEDIKQQFEAVGATVFLK